MIYIGNHVSVSKGYLAMGRHETSLGGNTFAFFPRNPRGGKSKAVKDEDIAALAEYLGNNDFGKLVAMNGIHGMAVFVVDNEFIQAKRKEMILAAELLRRFPDKRQDPVFPGQHLHHHIVLVIVVQGQDQAIHFVIHPGLR